MKVGGGILALIAAGIAVIMGFVTLFIGGVDSALDGENADQLMGMGWLGILLSFIIIGFAIGCIVGKTKMPAIVVIVLSVVTAVAGGTLVAIFMVLSIIGGLLALIGVNKEQKQQSQTAAQ